MLFKKIKIRANFFDLDIQLLLFKCHIHIIFAWPCLVLLGYEFSQNNTNMI